jgi:membrane fusion protein (multidrug efflux system)
MNRVAGRGGWAIWLAAGLGIVSGAGGCGRPQAAGPGERPKPQVTVVAAEARDVPIESTNIGTTVALQSVVLRPRVSAVLTEKHFEEGKNIQEGQLLLVFDRATYQAAADAAAAKVAEAEAKLGAAEQTKAIEVAQAQLQLGQARLALAQVDEARGRRLSERGAQTREEYDTQVANLRQAEADVQSKQADLLQARVDKDSNIALARANLAQAKSEQEKANLDLQACELYATIDGRKGSPPIRGRAGELKVKLGNFVDPMKVSELVSIQQLDPMGVDIQCSSRYLPEVTALLSTGLQTNLTVQGERAYPHPAEVFFLDNRVEPTTSTVLLRCRVPNPEEALLPGDYVQTRTVIGSYTGVVVVPEQAVIQTQAGPVCYVVDAGGKVALRSVQALDVYRGLQIVDEGLEPGEAVIVEGLQLVRPGQEVQARTSPMGTYEREDASRTPAPGGGRPRLIDNPKAQLNGTPPPAAAPEAPAAEPPAAPAPTPGTP